MNRIQNITDLALKLKRAERNCTAKVTHAGHHTWTCSVQHSSGTTTSPVLVIERSARSDHIELAPEEAAQVYAWLQRLFEPEPEEDPTHA